MTPSWVVHGLLLVSMMPLSLYGQGNDQRPVIEVIAGGSSAAKADHAVLTVGISIQDSTPTAAGAEMDRRLMALTDTLQTLGFPAESLPNAAYQVTPDLDFDSGRQIVSYTATAAVRLTFWDMAKIPALVEVALAAGATDVSNLRFASSDERDARDDALRNAMSQAKHDAEVLAQAAGGQLGDLTRVSSRCLASPTTDSGAYGTG